MPDPNDAITRRAALGMLASVGLFGISNTALRAASKAPSPPGSGPSAWVTLPPTPELPKVFRSGLAKVNGTEIFFAQFGQGPPVLLLHGGLGNSNYWGSQIADLAKDYTVIVMDTRGHGRSPLTPGEFSFEAFAQDASALLAFLDLSSVAVVGWSDGGITGLQLAINRDKRISKLFAFAANSSRDAFIAGGSHSEVFAAYTARCRVEYAALSPYPERWPLLVDRLGAMWRREPNFTKAQLASIAIPVMIAAGDHDEIIKAEHTKAMADQIARAKLAILPGVSHFAMLQDAAQFNGALRKFLNGT